MRGLPGSGKSTIARQIKSQFPDNTVIVSADDYFITEKGYVFDKNKLGAAHTYCFFKFNEAVKLGTNVIVDNTNLSEREYSKYLECASGYGYSPTVITVETSLNDEQLHLRNTHGVPVESIKRMRERMKHG
jgi:predicted kinase